jgi:glycosyltransferase involved in cell wall biosynthesis
VLIHSFDYPPLDGGIAQLSARLAQALDRRETVLSSVRYPEGAQAMLARARPRIVLVDGRKRLGVGDRLVAFTVARLVGWKGIDVVIDAIAQLGEAARRSLVYLVSGRGPEEGALRQRARARGVEDSIRFLGFVASDELPGIYRAADVVVLCSRATDGISGFEGFGLVLLEAQASDAIGDAPGGWLVDDGSASGVAAALGDALLDPAAVRSLGQANREAVERRGSWDAYTARLVEELAVVGIRSSRARGCTRAAR